MVYNPHKDVKVYVDVLFPVQNIGSPGMKIITT
jgi:hypothetical protein